MVGAGASGGSMDASNLLKPMLGRGELRCIGATTLDEYRKYIEKDPALERRFQQVTHGQYGGGSWGDWLIISATYSPCSILQRLGESCKKAENDPAQVLCPT